MKCISKFKYKFDLEEIAESNNGDLVVDETQKPLSVREILDRFSIGIPINHLIHQPEYDESKEFPDYSADTLDLNQRLCDVANDVEEKLSKRTSKKDQRDAEQVSEQNADKTSETSSKSDSNAEKNQ